MQYITQYASYDSNDFVADVGGYLGLLLGHSVLAIYDLLAGGVGQRIAKCLKLL